MKLKQAFEWLWRGPSLGAQRARRAIKTLFILALFVGLFWIIPIQEVIRALASTKPLEFSIGFVFSFLSTCLTAVQLQALIRKQGINKNALQILSITLAAKFYSTFAPGNIVATGVKWYKLAQPEGKVAEALAAVAFFRLLETFLNIVFGLAFWLLSRQQSLGISIGWFIALVIGIVLFWLGVTRLSMPFYTWFNAKFVNSGHHPSWKKPLRWAEKFLVAVAAYANIPVGDLLLSILAGVLSQLSGVVSNVFMAWAVGIKLSFMDMAWIYSVIILISQLPFAFAGGLGFREVTLVAIMPSLGISSELALAFSFLLFIRGILVSLVGGLSEGFQALRGERHREPEPSPDQLKET